MAKLLVACQVMIVHVSLNAEQHHVVIQRKNVKSRYVYPKLLQVIRRMRVQVDLQATVRGTMEEQPARYREGDNGHVMGVTAMK